MKIFKSFIPIVLCFIISCDERKEAPLKSSKKRFISIARYKPGEKECSRGVFLDSTGFDYHFCLFGTAEDINKKISIKDEIAFKFIEELDTTTLKTLETCVNYKGKWSGYFYEIFFDYGNINTSIMLREQSLLCPNGQKIDSIKSLFVEFENEAPFWKRKSIN